VAARKITRHPVPKHAPIHKHRPTMGPIVTDPIMSSGYLRSQAQHAMISAGAHNLAGTSTVSKPNRSPVYAPHGNVQSSVPAAIRAGLTQVRPGQKQLRALAPKKATPTRHKVPPRPKGVKATVPHGTAAHRRIPPPPKTTSAVVGGKPATSSISASDGGGAVSPLNSGGFDTGGGGLGDLLGGLAHYALIAGVVVLLIYAWRKGYIQKLGKSVSRIGK
jgi:hypothetical protein